MLQINSVLLEARNQYSLAWWDGYKDRLEYPENPFSVDPERIESDELYMIGFYNIDPNITRTKQ